MFGKKKTSRRAECAECGVRRVRPNEPTCRSKRCRRAHERGNRATRDHARRVEQVNSAMPARIELITPKPTRPPQRRRNPVDDVELHALAWRLQQRRDVLLHNIGQLSRPLLELGGPECRADIATLKQITRAARDLDDAVIERMTSMDGRDVHKYGSSVARQLDEHERKLNRLIRKWEANRAFTVTRKKPGRGTAR